MIEIGSVDTNLTTGGAQSVQHGAPALAMYQKNQADSVASADMSFGDFLDMINPLQHIPLVSDAYRSLTGDKINPVSRIAGDTLYSGALGGLSAGIAAAGAIGSEAVAANNGGQSVSGILLASMAGDAPDATTQVADAAQNVAQQGAQQAQQNQTLQTVADSLVTGSAPVASEIQLALSGAGLLQTQAQQSPILQMPDTSTAASAQTVASAATPATNTATAAATGTALNAAKALPLDRSKSPYGGVMDTAMMESAQQNQQLALALAGQRGVLQAQHNLRNSRFAAVADTAATNSAQSPTQAKADPQTQMALQKLLNELQASKTLKQYSNTAQSTVTTGASVDLTN